MTRYIISLFCKEEQQWLLRKRRCNVWINNWRKRQNFCQPHSANWDHTSNQTYFWYVGTSWIRPWYYQLPILPVVIWVYTSFIASASMSESSGISMIFDLSFVAIKFLNYITYRYWQKTHLVQIMSLLLNQADSRHEGDEALYN